MVCSNKSESSDLFERAQQGDEIARNELCRLYSPRLAASFGKHGLARESIEDAVQETLMRMIDALDARRINSGRFEGWLFATARNVRVDMIRRESRGRSEHPDQGLSPAADLPEHAETHRLVQEAIERLPESLRSAFKLRFDQELSYRAIAAELEISVNAVGLRLYRARKMLQRQLHEKL